MTEQRLSRTALGQLGLAVALLGAGWPVTKTALLDGASASGFGLGRAVLSMVMAAVAVGVSGKGRLPARADLPALAALGLLQLGGFFAFAHAAVAWVPAGRTAILSNATLIWTVPIALLVTGEAISARRWTATLLSAAGVVVLVGPWAIDWTSGTAMMGHAFLLCASLSWAVAMAIVRRWPPRMTMFQLLPWAFAIASLALLPVALSHDAGVWSMKSIVCLGLVGLVMGPIGTWCIIEATTSLPLVVVSVGFLAGPALGLLLSVAWLGEALTVSVGLGAVLLLSAAGLAASNGRGA